MIGSKYMLSIIDVQPISIPQLKVRPKKSCGQYVILFINGYTKSRIIELIPKTIVNKLNCKSMTKAIRQRIVT